MAGSLRYILSATGKFSANDLGKLRDLNPVEIIDWLCLKPQRLVWAYQEILEQGDIDKANRLVAEIMRSPTKSELYPSKNRRKWDPKRLMNEFTKAGLGLT